MIIINYHRDSIFFNHDSLYYEEINHGNIFAFTVLLFYISQSLIDSSDDAGCGDTFQHHLREIFILFPKTVLSNILICKSVTPLTEKGPKRKKHLHSMASSFGKTFGFKRHAFFFKTASPLKRNLKKPIKAGFWILYIVQR